MEPHDDVGDREPSVPKRWQMRAIRFQRRGFPPQTLLTSMRDPKAFPAAEIITLYHERWERGDPKPLSFVLALNLVRDEWSWCAHTSPGAIPRHPSDLREKVARFVLPERRSDPLPTGGEARDEQLTPSSGRPLSDRHWR